MILLHPEGEFNQTMLIVTHDPEFAAGTHRIIEMEDGRVDSGI
jgi:lipoprotein-releasing system ATP-binding protein